MSKLFYVNGKIEKLITYEELFTDIKNTNKYSNICCSGDTYNIFKHIIVSILLNQELILLDHDFSKEEIKELLGGEIDQKSVEIDTNFKEVNHKLLSNAIDNNSEWKITLFTSGTTGLPKKVTHNLRSITRLIKRSEKREKDVWGFAYNPTHMAGIQVFFQAVMNMNPLINIFNKPKEEILSLIAEYKITHISATPTYYLMLLPMKQTYDTVVKLTFGGEKMRPEINEKLKQGFPNSTITNIYASTEAGAIFVSNDEIFGLNKGINQQWVKILDGRLMLHKNLLGSSESIVLENDWYDTQDIVEVMEKNPLKFKFVSRKNEMINVGGYKVNPYEVESAILELDGVKEVRVFAKPNSILGNIICCEIKPNDNIQFTVAEIRKFLEEKLQSFKVPRIIKFVKEIEKTRSGKIKR